MPINSIIRDATGTGKGVTVTEYNQLVTAPAKFSESVFNKLDVINTAYNFTSPSSGERDIITDIILYANKNVGAGDATVEIYEADGPTSTDVSKSVLKLEMLKQTSVVLTGLNLITTEGKWLNAKTDDDDIFLTIMTYKISVPRS